MPGQLHGAPVLFIPGNAGSSHQVRSIASSAARQYFSSPYHVAEEFAQGRHSALDFFARRSYPCRFVLTLNQAHARVYMYL